MLLPQLLLSFPSLRSAGMVGFVVVPPFPFGSLSSQDSTCLRHGVCTFRRARRVPRCNMSRGPSTPPPDYTALDAKPQNIFFMHMFACRLADELGVQQPIISETNYDVVMDLVSALTSRANGEASALTAAAVRVLETLFPAWLPPAFAALFSRPFPRFAAWLNAVVTIGATRWLMGPMKLADDGSSTVVIERCRYLESNGCVGTCLNSCKIATESFFETTMGLPLYISPDFTDFSCKFAFGVEPPPDKEQTCLTESCFTTCPARAGSAPARDPPVPSMAPCVSLPRTFKHATNIEIESDS
jgi:Beta-carotene isomerase D27-like, C-terminal